MKNTLAVLISALVFFVIFVALSYLINVVGFAEAHAQIRFFRNDDDPLGSYLSLSITTAVWSILIAFAYYKLQPHINGTSSALKGLKYGAWVFLFFIWQQEVLYFQFVQFNWGILVSALIHMALAFTMGGAAIAVVQEFVGLRVQGAATE